MHKREATVPGPSPAGGGAGGNVGSSPEGGEGVESDFVMVPEHLTMDAAEVRGGLRKKHAELYRSFLVVTVSLTQFLD